MQKQVHVVGAVIVRDGLVLGAQRRGGSLDGTWEFPGGKVEVGEEARSALVREVREELGVVVSVGEAIAETIYEYDFSTIRLDSFYCQLVAGEPAALEHSQLRWFMPGELRCVRWAPADVPAVSAVAVTLTSIESGEFS